MLDKLDNGKMSALAFHWLIGSAVVTFLLAFPHGFLQGWHYGEGAPERDRMIMLSTIVSDLRYFTEQLIYVSALIFVGAKFFETRTTFAVTFDRLDAAKISVKGPDGDNVVWIGQRYTTPLEAQSVADMLENRLKESA
ncbi:MAG TPA: hypothetical protein VG387_05175 [Rhizomicrobium sp.]|jgi:hypothetical protein|nr:hypothetical protein [Rhizomicrobium sp.]